MNDERWNRYLFERHSRAEIAEWARRLRYFRFCRAYGGHAGDGDRLLAAIALAGTVPDIREVLGILGIAADPVPVDAPQPIPGVSYTAEAFERFVRIAPGPLRIRQPGHVTLGGHTVLVYLHPGRLELSMSDVESPFEVTQAVILSAEAVEAFLLPLANRLIDPPQADRNCLSPATYPEFWL
ncbi:hypothetical protein C5L14_05110 [Labrys okinawensis]|uniref:Uncharacterized protein n=1 Tax=Labrys okinawensis TaxID=346911 RepID=A0A2S9QH09_9HYPH|nr:hypothetical protein [Labrys okinawensis]PRH88615.1 hypothetical protein C5L14_05110 [Labrys okinawensis]